MRRLTNYERLPAKPGPPVFFHGFDFAPVKMVCPEQAASQIRSVGGNRALTRSEFRVYAAGLM
jgi:hypothetical protein